MQRLKNSNDSVISNSSFGEPDPLHIAWSKFVRTYNVVLRARDRELEMGGFCHWHAALLNLLHVHGEGLSISEIASLAGLRNHTVSAVVMRVEKAGLVKRAPDVNDSRVVRVESTQRGRKEYARSLQLRGHIHNIMGSLGDEQMASFLESLDVLKHQAEVELRALNSPVRNSRKANRKTRVR